MTRRIVYTLLFLAAVGTGLVTLPLPSTGTDLDLPVPPLAMTDGYAARWDTCTLTYSLNPAHAPRGAVFDFTHATRLITAATGVTFTRVADNTLVLQADQAEQLTGHPGQPDLLVDWALPPGSANRKIPTSNLLDQPHLAGEHVAAKTELFSAFRGRRGIVAPIHHITGSSITFEARHGTARGRAGQLGYAMHELGHVLGLGHTGDSASLMYYFGAVDRNYLTESDKNALRAIAPPNCHPAGTGGVDRAAGAPSTP